MRSGHAAAIMVLALSLAAVPANAQTDAFVSEVQAGDGDTNREGSTVLIEIGFVDADGDGRLDASNPDETAYLIFGGDQEVDFGDIRLTRFLTYPPGTAVNYTNRDLGLATRTINGWFAQDDQGNWYVDVNDDGQITVGELAVEPGDGIEKVQPGDPAVGTSVEKVQPAFTPAERFIYIDEGPAGADWTDRFYLDLDGNQQPNPGELRFEASRLGIDDNPTGREFRQTVQDLRATDEELREELVENDEQTQSRIDTLEAELAQTRDDLETMDNWLLALGLVDLVAVAGVGYWVYSHHHEDEEE